MEDTCWEEEEGGKLRRDKMRRLRRRKGERGRWDKMRRLRRRKKIGVGRHL